jgi:hypothetical protein
MLLCNHTCTHTFLCSALVCMYLTLQGMGHRDAGVASGVPQVPGVTVGPRAINGSSASTASVAAAAVDSLFGGQMQPGAEQQQQQQAAQ